MAKKLYGAAAAAHAKKMGRSKKRRSHSKAITHTRTRKVYVKSKRRSRKHGGGGMKLTHLALATAGLAFLTQSGKTDGIQGTINNAMAKVPGTKTFGATAMLGIGALAVDRFIKPNRWLRLLGTAGVVLAASQIGQKGTDFKFLGDGGGETGAYDLDDVSDLDDVDDVSDLDDVSDVEDE